MSYRLDVISSRQLSARWCALAERRLDHLTELFETGRWRRYYSERMFLDNIREAKRAVKNWRALSRGEQIEKQLEISFVVEEDDFSLTRPLQKQADQSVRPEPPIRFAPITSLAPSIETMIASADIMMPEQMSAQDEVVEPYDASGDYDFAAMDDSETEISDLPADIILPDFVNAMPRIDLSALESALNVESAQPDPAAQNFHDHDALDDHEIEDDRIEDDRIKEAPVLDLDAIARKYPALRHTL